MEEQVPTTPPAIPDRRRTWLQRKFDSMTVSQIIDWLDKNPDFGEPLPGIRLIKRSRPYKKPLLDDPSPGFENAVRLLEDHAGD